MQKAIIVKGDHSSDVDKLNVYLERGWKVVEVCPMPSSPSTSVHLSGIEPQCLVIIEKEDE